MKKDWKQTLGEEIANAISHGVMALFGILALTLLLIKANTTIQIVSAIIFGFGIINLYTMSTLYHSLFHKTAKGLFKRFDHLSIYLLIGGTFAPQLLLLPELQTPLIEGFNMGIGPLMFIVQWSLIITGVVFKSIWIDKFHKVHIFLYLAMGWSGLVFLKQLLAFEQAAFWLVLAGGIAYSVGVVFYIFGRVKYFHFVWHIFTGVGTILHFLAIYIYLY